MHYMGSRSFKGKGNFWRLSGPLKSIASHCYHACSKKLIMASARLLQPTTLLVTGWCHINFPHSERCDRPSKFFEHVIRYYYYYYCYRNKLRDIMKLTTHFIITTILPLLLLLLLVLFIIIHN